MEQIPCSPVAADAGPSDLNNPNCKTLEEAATADSDYPKRKEQSQELKSPQLHEDKRISKHVVPATQVARVPTEPGHAQLNPLACPFHKYNSTLFGPDSPLRVYRGCGMLRFPNIRHLKSDNTKRFLDIGRLTTRLGNIFEQLIVLRSLIASDVNQNFTRRTSGMLTLPESRHVKPSNVFRFRKI